MKWGIETKLAEGVEDAYSHNLKLKYKLFFVYILCFGPIVINLIFYYYMIGMLVSRRTLPPSCPISLVVSSDLQTVTLCNGISNDRTPLRNAGPGFPAEIEYVEAYYNYFLNYLFINGESYPQISKAIFYTDNDTILTPVPFSGLMNASVTRIVSTGRCKSRETTALRSNPFKSQ